uniref:Mitochondrial import inner membrane translocase subunit n=1 Tax=Schizaphis graminum TaxID=13262 RepID=A0A2S2NS89_SCHGA
MRIGIYVVHYTLIIQFFPTNYFNIIIFQVKEIFKSYNKLTELCFMDCATDFTVGDLKSDEVRCAENCTSKFLKASERMTQRFQEYQLIMNEHVITAQQNANA